MATPEQQQPLSAVGVGNDFEASTSGTTASSLCRHFEYPEILKATRNFDESLVIGRGGFGKVYMGLVTYEASHIVAAIKRLDPESTQGVAEFWSEVEMLSMLRNDNIVSLIGYCSHEKEKILVYEYMLNGTLDDHLHKLRTPLSWVMRLKICIEAGCGLRFLHHEIGTDSGIIHRDVKSPNILLHKSWTAKISDFGLSKTCPTNQHTTYVKTQIKGSFGYFDPSYFQTGMLTRKSDVFAFGVVLLEVLCRKRAVDRTLDEDQWSLVEWVKDSIKEGKLKRIIDSDITGEISPKCLKEFVKLVDRCLQDSPKRRPTMVEVVNGLENALNLQERFMPAGRRTISGETVDMLPSNGENYAEKDSEVHLGQLKRFSLRELQVATDNFGNRHILGRGGFGKVYKGRLADGTLVAVKRLKEERTQGAELQFQMEVEMFSMAMHQNLLRLKGFCMTTTECLLVFPFMANGSVASCLRERPENQEPIDWPTRKRIALGSARGLAYLHEHCDPKIIHRDVKAAKILLDEEFEAVVGDFGLAILMDRRDTHVTDAVRGTIGHIAPEYLSTGEFCEKVDVFGYGVMLLELITGQRAYDLARLANDDDVMLLDWVKGLLRENELETLVDTDLNVNYIDIEVEQLIHVALLCTQGTPLERPKMSEVVRMLEGDWVAERWEEWQREMFGEEFNTTHNPNTDWIIQDSTYNLRPDELSGPR